MQDNLNPLGFDGSFSNSTRFKYFDLRFISKFNIGIKKTGLGQKNKHDLLHLTYELLDLTVWLP